MRVLPPGLWRKISGLKQRAVRRETSAGGGIGPPEAGGADFIIIYNHEDPPASVLKLIESARVPPGLRPGMNKEHKREACPRPQGAD